MISGCLHRHPESVVKAVNTAWTMTLSDTDNDLCHGRLILDWLILPVHIRIEGLNHNLLKCTTPVSSGVCLATTHI